MVFGVAVLSASQHSHVDDGASARIVRDVLENEGDGNFSIVETLSVPLDTELISSLLTDSSQRAAIDVVLVVGGIGVGQQECTPEVCVLSSPSDDVAATANDELIGKNAMSQAVSPLLQRSHSGTVHIILQSLPEPLLWRPVAGFIGKTMVITLPRKPKYLRRSLTALLSSSLHCVLEVVKDNLTSDSIVDEDDSEYEVPRASEELSHSE